MGNNATRQVNLFKKRFARTSDAEFTIRISDEERDLLDHLVPQLRELLMSTAPSGNVDPMTRRLFPTAYNQDAKDDADYQELMRDRLLVSRLESLEILETTTRATTLNAQELEAWANAINQLRLVLGTRLDVTEDDEPTDMDPDDPNTAPLATYHYLGHLLGEILDVRMR